MTTNCRFLEEGRPYQRTVTGWVDTREPALLQLNARLADGAVDLDVSLVAEPSPSYAIATASVRAVTGVADSGPLVEAFRTLGGTRIVGGFRRHLAGLMGDHPLASRFVDAAIEAARLSRQVTRLDVAGPAPEGAAAFHRLDLEAWPELLDLCFTYRAESQALFAERAVRTPATLDTYAPPPGRTLVFHRYKRTHVSRDGSTLSLYQSMFDPVHGFELWFDVDASRSEVVDARLLTPRLPYMGLCEEPQRRVRSMIGARLGADWAEVVRGRLGGRQGCFQLTDLSSDLFRLLTFGVRP
jgi:Protein of unknown function (DUF2889)